MFLAAVKFNPVEHLYDRWAVWVTLWGAHGTEFIKGWNGTEGLPGYMHISQHVIMMWIVAAGMIAVIGYVTYARNSRVPRGLRNLIEPVLLFIRNDIVRPNIKNPHAREGKEARAEHWLADKFVPFMFCLFVFIAGLNLIGLLPGASTATSGIVVTGGLALLVLVVYMIGALWLQGPLGFLRNMVPYKFSWAPIDVLVWGLLFFIEGVGVVAKPFALTVRLFANMTAGHCSLLSMLFINQLIGPDIAAWRFATGIPTVGMAIGLYFLDIFVALLQAYIFTYLSAIFIGQYLVPEH